MSIAAAFFLFFASGSEAPGLTPIASFADREACIAAKEASQAALAEAMPFGSFACLSSDGIATLGAEAF